ncbi:MAG: hypothetical protein Ta2B_24890 [Termitinemataceae bacterium]|nr:MAG: hypothetical protein Ta2B_24890 [Termitinemataceae bacterium]
MEDIGILELLIAFFLYFYLARPFLKSLWNVPGIVMFPPLALLCIIGMFFAYGFRPELLPLLICTLIINITNFSAFIGVFFSLHNTDYREQGVLIFFVLFFMLSFSMFAGLYFSPLKSSDLLSENIYTINLTNTNSANEKNDYFIRVYDPKTEAEKSNVIFVVPPLTGSVKTIDSLCGTLRDAGFRVVTYSNKSLDIPSVNGNGNVFLPPFSVMSNVIKSCNKAWLYKKSNDAARILEDRRKEDLAFLSSFIETLTHSGNTSAEDSSVGNNLFFIAYNEGGGALLNNINNIFNTNKNGQTVNAAQYIKGIIVIESLLASSYKDAAIDSVPSFNIPVLFLMSDSINNADKAQPYAAVLLTQKNNPAFTAIKSLQGYGHLDYSDIPQKYPVIPFLFNGKNETNKTVNETADIMLQFIRTKL